MASVDVRTRSAADVRAVDPTDFLELELPRLLEARADPATGNRKIGDGERATVGGD